MTDDDVRKAAYEKWEREGRPEGQQERHWLEAEKELKSDPDGLPKTWTSDGSSSVAPPSSDTTTSDAIPDDRPGSFKPGELASENK